MTRKKSVPVQYRHNLNFFLNIFNTWLVESANVEGWSPVVIVLQLCMLMCTHGEYVFNIFFNGGVQDEKMETSVLETSLFIW